MSAVVMMTTLMMLMTCLMTFALCLVPHRQGMMVRRALDLFYFNSLNL
jgi:hypothetical protein